jgi:hypothetical protein
MLGNMFVLSKAGPVQGLLWHKKQKYYIFIRKKLKEEMFLMLFFCAESAKWRPYGRHFPPKRKMFSLKGMQLKRGCFGACIKFDLYKN